MIVPAKILVVDDTEMNRDMLSTLVEADGHKASVAVNGRVGLEMLKAEPFDLVLLDVMMPEMNGYQVLEQLKADANLRAIPVIVLSALDEIGSVVRCIELGAEELFAQTLRSCPVARPHRRLLGKKTAARPGA